MTLRRELRGQPLSVLSAILGGWVVLRVLTWQPPDWEVDRVAAAPVLPEGQVAATEELPAGGFDRGPVSFGIAGGYGDPQAGWFDRGGMPVQPMIQPVAITVPVAYPAPDNGAAQTLAAAGHQLMWMAALAKVTVPQELAAYVSNHPQSPESAAPKGMPGWGQPFGNGGQVAPAAPAPVPLSPGLAEGRKDRWSADAWMLARRESAAVPASARPLYGGSQAGAVLRYRLAPQSRINPIAYARVTSSLGTVKESEVALGLGARPLPSLPLVLAGEARAYRDPVGKTQFRPAVLAYTELPPADLPLGFRGEAYLQGGYVGGTYKTGFVDGHVRIDRPLMDIAGTSVRVGGGIWGGAQKGVSRLDAGPGASAQLDLVGAPSRVSMDWRFRLLGDAQPDSGPALTISAGF